MTDLSLLSEKVEESLAKKQTKNKSILFSFIGVFLLAVLGFLIYQGLTHSIVYFRTVQQAVSQRAQLKTQTFQIEGAVQPGSIKHDKTATYFNIVSGNTILPVKFTSEPDQLFQNGIPVVLVGHFLPGNGPGGTQLEFISNQMMIRHSNVYIAKYPTRITELSPKK